ncbi:hypothetical protein EGT07_10150 [Herbaspirillum sp. HC18]|nr:hypothetical protein EGT07_10150 [Herbaspirillum sp. HC18]
MKDRDSPQRQKEFVYARYNETGNAAYLHSRYSGYAEKLRRTRFLTGSTSSTSTIPGTTAFNASAMDQPGAAQWMASAEQTLPMQHAHRGAPYDQVRVEPSLDDGGLPSDKRAFYEQFNTDGYAAHRPAARSVLRRVGMMLGVFAIGASVGLAVAWWLHSPVAGSPVGDAIQSPSSAYRSAQKASQSGRTPAVRGISSSELPYDGAAPPLDAADAPAVAAKPIGKNAEASSGSSASGGRTNGSRAPAAESPQQEQQEAMDEAVPPSVAAAKQKEPSDQTNARADTQARQAQPARKGSSVVSAVPKRKTPSRQASDREIERIRQQADDELKKKPERARGVGSAGSPNAANRTGSRNVITISAPGASVRSAMLARCNSASNFIGREICKWRVCNGSWGANGCPSYQPHHSSY